MTKIEKVLLIENLLHLTRRTAHRRVAVGKYTELEIHVLKQYGFEWII